MASRTDMMKTQMVTAGALALAGSIAALAACVGDDPGVSASSSSSGNGSSSTSSSSSSSTSSSGVSSSSGDIDSGPTPKFSTGKLDQSFKNGPRTDIVISYPQGVAIDKKSRTYVVGGQLGCVGGNSDFAIARFTPTGELDSTFGTAGRACVEFGTNDADEAYGVAFDDQNRIVAVGYTGNSIEPTMAAARFGELGQLDTATFNPPAGKVTIPDPGSAFAFAVVIDGAAIYVAGSDEYSPQSASKAILARLSANGTIEHAFGGYGYVANNVDAQAFRAVAVGGGFVFAAGTSKASPARAVIVRYSPTGTRDATWGAASPPSASTGSNFDVFESLDVLPDGRVLATGVANADPVLAINPKPGSLFAARFGATGAIDPTFNAGGPNPGVAIAPAPTGMTFQKVTGVVEADGRPVVAGLYDTTDGGAQDPALARLSIDGTPDTTFGTAGVAKAGSTTKQSYVIGVARDPVTAKVVVLSTTGQSGAFALHRFE
jgi:uncharacterized delta-60 repeat protein